MQHNHVILSLEMNPREQQTEGGSTHSLFNLKLVTVFYSRSKGIRTAFNRERVEHTRFNKKMEKFVMGVANKSRDLFFFSFGCWCNAVVCLFVMVLVD